MREHLYSDQLGRFCRSLQVGHDGTLEPDSTIDASMFGIFFFGCFSPDDEVVVGTINAIRDELSVAGGLAIQNDGDMKAGRFDAATPGIMPLCLRILHRAAYHRDMRKHFRHRRVAPTPAIRRVTEQLDRYGQMSRVSPVPGSHSNWWRQFCGSGKSRCFVRRI